MDIFTDAFNKFIRSKLDKVHTILPGKIEQYYGHTQRKARVKPFVKPRNINNEIIDIDPIDNVPVIFPSTKNFNMLFPINKGDGVLLLFAEAGIGNFLNSTSIQEADDLNKFSLDDCIAIPGLWSFLDTPKTVANNNDFYLIYEDAQIHISKSTNEIIIKNKSGQIKIDLMGNIGMLGATEAFVKGNAYQQLFNIFLSVLGSQVGGTPAQNAAAIAAIAAAANAANAQLSNTLSQRIKGE